MSLLLLFRPSSGGSSGALAGSCDLVFAAGSSTLAGSSGTLTATNAAAMIFGVGSTTLKGAGDLTITPGGGDGAKMVFGTLVLYLDGGGALVGTNAAAMIFDRGSTTLTGELEVIELPILVMARSLA